MPLSLTKSRVWTIIAVVFMVCTGLVVAARLFVFAQFGERDPGWLPVTNDTRVTVQLFFPQPEGVEAFAVWEPIAPGERHFVLPCVDQGYEARGPNDKVIEAISAGRSCELSEWVIDGSADP